MHTSVPVYGEKTENHGKWEIHTLGHEIWRGKLKKVENLEMSTVGRGIWQENWKSWKMRNIHLRTWKMTKSLKNMKIEKCTLLDLKYGEKTENHGKWETSTWWLEKWRHHWKTWKMRNANCRTWNMARKLKITENE